MKCTKCYQIKSTAEKKFSEILSVHVHTHYNCIIGTSLNDIQRPQMNNNEMYKVLSN